MGRIVVGIDSSEDAQRALHFGLQEAALRHASLELVHAYPTPELVALPQIVTMPSDDELRTAALGILDTALERAGGVEGIDVIRTVRPGSIARVLCEVADGADLLVVGARGLGGFRGLLLGSVTHAVVAHARCPVIVAGPGWAEGQVASG